MGQTTFPLLTLLAVSTLSVPALAQAAAPAAPSTATAAPSPDSTPPPPDVKDPMLEPVPPAPNVLASWKDALRLVRQRSTALRISQAGVEQAKGLTERTQSASMPKLTGNANLNHHFLHGIGTNFTAAGVQQNVSIPTPDTTLNGSLDLRQPLLNFGAWYSIGTAREREHVAELSLEDTQRQLLGTVAQSAVGVVTAGRVAEVSRVSLASALSTLDLTKRRAQLGAASAVDVLRAAQEVAQSRAQIVSADESLIRAREALGAALGDTIGWGVSADIRVEDLERTAGEVCRPIESLEARADIRSAAKAVDAAVRDQKSVDFTYVPTLDLVSSLGYTSLSARSPNNEHLTWTIGGQLVWPLYDGGDRYGLKRYNEAAVAIAREQLTQQKRTLVLQVLQADRAIAVAQATLEVSRSSRDLAKESARLSRLAFVNGSGTSFDLVDSARKLREAEIDLLIKDFQVFQARLTAFLARANCAY